MYEQFKECIENSLKYLSPGCRKAMFQVMCKNIDEFKFAGLFGLKKKGSKAFFLYLLGQFAL